MEICEGVTGADLARLDLFKDDSPEALEWLAPLFEVRCYEPGEPVVKSGEPALEFMVVLEGEIHFLRDGQPYGAVFIRGPGQPSGVLPFSRMTVFRGRGWAVGRSRAMFMQSSHFPELVHKAPFLAQKLVNEMIDRARDSTMRDERGNKMLALGKLSAGLAHELNNPASAVVRSSARLREVLVERRGHSIALRGELLTPQAQNLMLELSQIMTDAALNPKELDALDRLDREAEFSDWLGLHGFSDAASAAFIESGIQVNQVESLSKLIRHDSFEHLLRILAADHAIFSLSREIEEASRRIADLVQAVKAYSYMDRLPVTEVDVEQGIEVTLRMFQHELKHNFQVKKSFSGDLPKIRANGGELNQIWTNLIDNAIDAMAESETKVLEVRTCTEPGGILVEIIDSGPGIPAEIQARIFDAFFTTKEVGKGTGLGLDIVHRIVRDHHGSIRVSSRPGRTVFQVRLPDQSVRDGHGAG